MEVLHLFFNLHKYFFRLVTVIWDSEELGGILQNLTFLVGRLFFQLQLILALTKCFHSVAILNMVHEAK